MSFLWHNEINTYIIKEASYGWSQNVGLFSSFSNIILKGTSKGESLNYINNE